MCRKVGKWNAEINTLADAHPSNQTLQPEANVKTVATLIQRGQLTYEHGRKKEAIITTIQNLLQNRFKKLVSANELKIAMKPFHFTSVPGFVAVVSLNPFFAQPEMVRLLSDDALV